MEFDNHDKIARFPLQEHLKADPRLITYDRSLREYTFETDTVE